MQPQGNFSLGQFGLGGLEDLHLGVVMPELDEGGARIQPLHLAYALRQDASKLAHRQVRARLPVEQL